jgi:tetratricopeptide (TPR) repeat protein
MSARIGDRYSVEVEAADETAVAVLDEAVHTLVGLEGDPVAAISAAADRGLVLARCLLAYLHCYSGSRRGYALARDVLDGTPSPSTPREKAHLAAARSWAGGDLDGAVGHLERALLRHPHDLLALKIAHDLYFTLGDQVNLRDVAARVLPAWPEGTPGAGFVSGMYAFGLAECGDYRTAERYGRTALAANARDAWAVHAVLHVFEMEGRQADGLAFVAETARNWAPSFFSVHNWWHAGLYHLELGQLGHALAIYDNRVAAQALATPLGRIDAASLLWRLWLHGADIAGADIGGRASALADAFEATLSDSAYCFNDWHAAMALALAGRLGTAYGLVAELATRASGTNEVMLQRAGLDVMFGVIAFARRQYPSAVELLGQARRHASVLGGSHAQRDVIDLTLLAAAAACSATAGNGRASAGGTSDGALVRALVAERVARKPTAGRAARLVIETSQARAARYRSAQHRSAKHRATLDAGAGWGAAPAQWHATHRQDLASDVGAR